jgi:hypothetical protein
MHYKLEDVDLMNVVVSRADVDWISLCGIYCIASKLLVHAHARVVI